MSYVPSLIFAAGWTPALGHKPRLASIHEAIVEPLQGGNMATSELTMNLSATAVAVFSRGLP